LDWVGESIPLCSHCIGRKARTKAAIAHYRLRCSRA